MDKELEQKKEYLHSYRRNKAEIKSIQESIEELRVNKMSPSMGAQDGMPRGNGISDLSAYAARLDELERRLCEKLDKVVQSICDISKRIEAMECPTERTLLRLRYICGCTWEQIAVELGYSCQWTHKLHTKALKNFKHR